MVKKNHFKISFLVASFVVLFLFTNSASATADLVVSSFTSSDSIVNTNEVIELRAVIRNLGSQVSYRKTVRFYRSLDNIISNADMEVSSDSVQMISPDLGFGIAILATVNGSDKDGTFWFGACVDEYSVNGLSNEIDASNNCSMGTQLTVLKRNPDLTIDSDLTLLPKKTVKPGEEFSLHFFVRNIGNGFSSNNGKISYYLSSDQLISTSDKLIDNQRLFNFAPGESKYQGRKDFTITTPGAYFIGACVSPQLNESNIGNQCSHGPIINVSSELPRPELLIDSVSISSGFLNRDQESILTAIVENQGDSQAPATYLRFYLSNDPIIEISDISISNNLIVESLQAEQKVLIMSQVRIAPSGKYFFGACVEPVAREIFINNQCSNAISIQIGIDAILPSILKLILIDSD